MRVVQDQDVEDRILELRKGLGGVTSTRRRPSSHA
jgi:hypothetical protein